MPQTDPHMQIARKIRSVETAKTELVQQVSEVFRAIQAGNERDMSESLGGIIAIAYFLGRQLGVDLGAMDRHACESLPRTLGNDSTNASDFDYVQRYLSSR